MKWMLQLQLQIHGIHGIKRNECVSQTLRLTSAVVRGDVEPLGHEKAQYVKM